MSAYATTVLTTPTNPATINRCVRVGRESPMPCVASEGDRGIEDGEAIITGSAGMCGTVTAVCGAEPTVVPGRRRVVHIAGWGESVDENAAELYLTTSEINICADVREGRLETKVSKRLGG